MRITLIDDEKILSAKIEKRLQNAGFVVKVYHGYKEFMRDADIDSHLYIIDISLADGSGFAIVEWLRKTVESKVPILIISWYGDAERITYGLNLWCDDYMVKPLVPEVMIARVRALMRRPLNLFNWTSLRYKNIEYNIDKKETHVWENRVYLTHKESLILELFLRQQWRIINRESLVSAVWWSRESTDVTDNTINATLSKMRRKIGDPFSLKTLYNEWYILE